MRIYDISQEIYSCKVFPGDPAPKREILTKISENSVCNLSSFSMCSHNGTLLGNESQTIGPEDAPMEVHLELLGAEIVLLEGIRLGEVSERVYLLNAAPINLGGSDGAPCRAVLIESAD